MKTEIREFLIQYPEFNNDNFRVKSIESNRYNGDYTINVFDYDYEDGEWVFLKSYWCKLWNNEVETTYQFEEEKFVRYNTIRVSIDDSDLVYSAHYDYNEDNYKEIMQQAWNRISAMLQNGIIDTQITPDSLSNVINPIMAFYVLQNFDKIIDQVLSDFVVVRGFPSAVRLTPAICAV